jgi:hypothetical protein
VALREATKGELLKEMESWALPCPPLGRTLTAREMEDERPPGSITVKVRV